MTRKFFVELKGIINIENDKIDAETLEDRISNVVKYLEICDPDSLKINIIDLNYETVHTGFPKTRS
jgi:hypothetical protein